MEYTVSELARLSGVSARTLRYYDEIGLLKPSRLLENGYRIYEAAQVDLLQQILFYRALGMPLAGIRAAVAAPGFDRERVLNRQLDALLQKKARIEAQIQTLRRTIRAAKGEETMNDPEKFACFKEQEITKNERAYGAEVRARFGDAVMEGANDKLRKMPQSEWQAQSERTERILALLKQLVEAAAEPGGTAARELFEAHRAWLKAVWPDGLYSPEAHRQLAKAYVEDERYRAYYDQAVAGGAEYLRRVIEAFTG